MKCLLLLNALCSILNPVLGKAVFGAETDASSPVDHRMSAIIKGHSSRRAAFYVRISSLENGFLCGATIVGLRWVLTTARCIEDYDTSDIVVEAANFHDRFHEVEEFKVANWFIHDSYEKGEEPKNNLALIKLWRSIMAPTYPILPLCREEVEVGAVLTAVGMGTTSNEYLNYPETLREAHFHNVPHNKLDMFRFEPCPEDLVCTSPLVDGASICWMDEGGPLFKPLCGSQIPDCLYGVASFARAKVPDGDVFCDSGSFFTKIMPFSHWIHKTMDKN